MFLFFCNNTFIIFIHGIGNILRNVTIEKCLFCSNHVTQWDTTIKYIIASLG